jgi:nucleoside-diphosphate-sugar epimerase
MRIFIAGATGALGGHLIPRLVANGHEVTGMTRSAAKADALRALGARPAVADALDAEGVATAVAVAEPEVIVHQLTALSGDLDLRRFDRAFAGTDRLRLEGTDNLLAAGRAVGVRRVVAQSYAGWPFARVGGPVKTEDDPLDPEPLGAMRGALAAIRHVEAVVPAATPATGLVLRYGSFYGPDTGLCREPEAAMAAMVRKRLLPIIGSGNGIWSFVHIEDAAAATAAAIERGDAGIYQVVDDEPAPVRVWLPALAAALGAPAPLRLPRWLGRLLAGEAVALMMTEIRGASNARAKRELDWQLRYPTWRIGFEKGLG